MSGLDKLDQLSSGLAERVRVGDRAAVSRAITLVESTLPAHQGAARQLLRDLESLAALAPPPTAAIRVGISGVPGVGKSTFIDSLGTLLTERGHRVGVLTVDPSSVRTGGSVLGDKTRMARLSINPNAYIRPSPTSGALGGVARATAQAMLILEAAGYDVVLIETVGVGQSEVTVAGMVDTFCYLTLARTGDQLQGLKKGIVELADVVAVNKADGGHEAAALSAARDLRGALRIVRGGQAAPQVATCSALADSGMSEVWQLVLDHRAALGDEGLVDKRAAQRVEFMWSLVREVFERRLTTTAVQQIQKSLMDDVRAGRLSVTEAADRIVSAIDESFTHDSAPNAASPS